MPLSPTLQPDWFAHVERVARRTLSVYALSGARLAQAIARVSQLYTRERSALAELQGDDEALCARLQFFLSRDLLKIHGPVAELARAAAFPERDALRVLDLGAGLGAATLGLSRSLHALGLCERLSVTAVDIDPDALEVAGELCADLSSLPGIPVELTTRVHDVRRGWPGAPGDYDVILLGLVLNELEAGGGAPALAEQLIRLSGLLRDDGVLIIIEPALRETSRALHAVRDVLAARNAAPYVFAPCLRRALPCPMLQRERDYCHERVPGALPERLAALARAAGLRDSDLTYSYLTLHRAPRSLHELRESPTLLRAVSGSLRTKGKIELWLCGAASAPRGMRLDRHESPANAAFEHAERGCVLDIEPGPSGDDPRLRIAADTRVELLQSWHQGEVAER
ncbi:MAG TPA: small ribosomal subunit Rsm22 family protein [Polyangiales bacterium]|nr:small ribosomal subunit Rsm22 family protein [Polyangiales bacterium]